MILGQHTLRSYDDQLDQLMSMIVRMGKMVERMVLLANQSLRKADEKLLEEARALDKEINALDDQIQETATVVLALRNPLAIDLRFVTSTIKIASILERAGDLAKNVIKRSLTYGAYDKFETTQKLEHMIKIVLSMLGSALKAIENNDAEEAKAVWRRDDEVDELYHQIFSTMQKEMAERPNEIPAATHLVFAAKNFERVADYATNLAKVVMYIASGKKADKSTLNS